MRIEISNALKEPGRYFPFEVKDPRTTVDEKPLEEPVVLAGEYVFSGEFLIVRAMLTAVVRTECGRCLKAYDFPISQDVEETFAHDGSDDAPFSDTGHWPLTGDFIDLLPIIEANLYLPLPMQYLCRPDCKGLCPICGTNNNETACACKRHDMDTEKENPFHILQQLVQATDEEETP